MVQYVPNPYKLECTRKGTMTEDHKKVVKNIEDHKKIVKNVLKGCIDDEKTKITTTLIRDKLGETGMKAIVMTADKILTYYSYTSGVETMQHSTWDLGKQIRINWNVLVKGP
eukprot:494595_1